MISYHKQIFPVSLVKDRQVRPSLVSRSQASPLPLNRQTVILARPSLPLVLIELNL